MFRMRFTFKSMMERIWSNTPEKKKVFHFVFLEYMFYLAIHAVFFYFYCVQFFKYLSIYIYTVYLFYYLLLLICLYFLSSTTTR